MYQEKLEHIITKMRTTEIANASETFIKVFAKLYDKLIQSSAVEGTAYIRENTIEPVVNIQEIKQTQTENKCAQIEAMRQTVIVKLNGGLGTTMGLNKAKSLLPVKKIDGEELTFLDVIVRQILNSRRKFSANLPLIFMNSNNTSRDTQNHLERYSQLKIDGVPLEIMQHYQPKITADSFEAVSYPSDPRLEWCPPGHGNFFTAIYDNNTLEALLKSGYRYAFISNSDNLGAVFDPCILQAFVNSGAGIMLELADKTADDIKGGHIVKLPSGQFVLREVAQIHPDDREKAMNPQRHPYFNTNSIWLDLAQLHSKLLENDGVLDLPLIKNLKTVNPVDPDSQKVVQLETAIGSAISCFPNATALKVPRSRFIPVKTTADYEKIRGDEYELDENFCLRRRCENER
jgi:UTP--glucose-1-phosphate uridylyltransferase